MVRICIKLLGFVIAAVGLSVLSGWLFNQNALKAFNPNLIIMVFNTALCFTLAGIALILPHGNHGPERGIPILIGYFLIIFAGLVLTQDITGTNFGIDQLAVSVNIEDYNPNPGRMAPPTSLCFIFCGCIIVALQSERKKWLNVFIHSVTLIVMIIVVVSITASTVRFELLYDWYKYGRMAVPTAMCFLFLILGLWISWYVKETKAGAYLENQERRIRLTGTVIITLVALSAGMSGFGILANQMEHTLELSLKEAYRNNANLVKNDIELSMAGAEPITTRLLLKRYLVILNNDPQNAEAKAVIKNDMESFIGANFIAAAVNNASGERISEVGDFTKNAELIISLNVDGDHRAAKLLWKNGLILQSLLPIEQDGKTIGTAIVEQKLLQMERLLFEPVFLGKTGEIRICHAESNEMMRCLPSNHHAQPFVAEPRMHNHSILPMDLALRSLDGMRIAKDYRDHQVISAYGPIGRSGLGMVVKIDAAEFYGPIREKMQYAIILVIALSCVGIFAQNIQLLPLVQRLVKSEARVKSIMVSVADGIITINEKGIIESVNPALCGMFGYGHSELVGKEAAVLMPRRLHTLQNEGMDHFLKTGDAQIVGKGAIELPAQHKDGHEFTVLLTISAIRIDNQKLLVGSMRDITERKRLDRLKNEFISTVSHELRTPLTSIRGSLGLMKAGIAGAMPIKAKEMTEIAYKNCERLILLINDILDIDKIESGEMRFDMKEENVNSLIGNAIEANAAYGERFSVRYHFEPLDPPPLVHVDADRFIQVLSNLLSNAAKFSKAGDEVRISLVREKNILRIAVTDSGPGIPEEFHSRIFSKFAQADSSSSRQKSGTGLGLNISKQIIERMKGKIGFTSEINKGATFWITLPEAIIKQSHADLAEAIEYLTANDIGFLPRILHAEDNYDFCRIISHSLQGKAIVHVAASVADASKLLRSNNYDLLILDLALPDGSGLRLLSQLNDDKQNTRVMILSASEVNDKTRSKVDMALVKSKISEDKIIEKILSLLQK